MRAASVLVALAAILAGCVIAPLRDAGQGTLSSTGVGVRADRETYSPMMSSTVGIGLTPLYAPSGAYKPVEYHWRTNFGYFVSWGDGDGEIRELGPDVRREGGKVYWTYDPVDIDQKKPPVQVVLRIREKNTQQVLGESLLRLDWTDRDTAVVKQPQ